MRILAFLAAVAAAMLVFRPALPIVTMANQLVAVAGWGLVLMAVPVATSRGAVLRAAWPLLAVFALAGTGCAIAIASGMTPASQGICVLGVLLLAAVTAVHGVGAGASDAAGLSRAVAIALLVGGVCAAGIAIVQILAPGGIDGGLIAQPTTVGRASGNIGQANQFADTLIWGLIALVPLADGRLRGRAGARLACACWCAAALLMLLGVVLTASRTGLVSLGLLAVWGIVDRGLGRGVRSALATAPAIAAIMVWAVGAWAGRHGVALVPVVRDEGGATAFRTEIWSQALTLIEAQPWLGVGWGGFGFAWSLTPFGSRGAGLVDNAHDLPLHLAVELGVPVALAMTGLLLAALWRAWRGVRRLPGAAGVGARSMLMIVVVVGLHSLLEFPLWFAHLLFPTAWAFGFALGSAATGGAAPAAANRVDGRTARSWRAFGALMIVLALSAWMDYLNVVPTFRPLDDAQTLEERIQRARASVLFSYEGDKAAAIAFRPTPERLPVIQAASHALVSGPLLMAWAAALNAQGQADKARYLAARVREFASPEAGPWFAPCTDPTVTAKPFQCLPPAVALTWHDFR